MAQKTCVHCKATVSSWYGLSDGKIECCDCHAKAVKRDQPAAGGLYGEKADPEPPADRFPKLAKGAVPKEMPVIGSGRFPGLKSGAKGERDDHQEKAAADAGRFPQLTFGSKAQE